MVIFFSSISVVIESERKSGWPIESEIRESVDESKAFWISHSAVISSSPINFKENIKGSVIGFSEVKLCFINHKF